MLRIMVLSYTGCETKILGFRLPTIDGTHEKVPMTKPTWGLRHAPRNSSTQKKNLVNTPYIATILTVRTVFCRREIPGGTVQKEGDLLCRNASPNIGSFISYHEPSRIELLWQLCPPFRRLQVIPLS